jgi:acetyl esterase/lipase
MKNVIIPNQLTFGEKIRVALVRDGIIPLIEFIGGKSYPAGRVTEHSYGELPNEKLDKLSTPKPSTGKIAIVHIHGGGWIGGSKGAFYSKPLLKFSDAGYPVFSINYPLAPQHPHPYMLHSLLKALSWIKKNYPEHEQIHLIGDSSGGNLAMMLGIFLSNPNAYPKDAIDISLLPTIKSIVNIYGVNDRFVLLEDGFPNGKALLKAYGGANAHEKDFVSEIPLTPMDMPPFDNLPPTFIVGAGKDKLLRSSIIYAEHLSKRFQNVVFKTYKDAIHGFFSFGKGSDELIDDILQFINNI